MGNGIIDQQARRFFVGKNFYIRRVTLLERQPGAQKKSLGQAHCIQ